MKFTEIIIKKRNGESLSESEIKFWIEGVVNQTIPEYQSSALLMAIIFQGMNSEETLALTKAYINSGEVYDLSLLSGISVDKHSTGGVGDKTTLALAPILAASGLKVAKLSGRGLGHTGGTLDKLESISGFNCNLSQAEFIDQVNDLGIAVAGQTKSIVPADKIIYALRDVTGTVDSIPLIAASVMSKKIAAGSQLILLDVKYGVGAFMKTAEEAEALAKVMIEIGRGFKKEVKAMITNMNQNLGKTIGNALEVEEALATLVGNGPPDFSELVNTSAEILLVASKLFPNSEAARKQIELVISNKQALLKFEEMVRAQKGNLEQFKKDVQSNKTQKTLLITNQEGYIKKINSAVLGECAMDLGAGRHQTTDEINHWVGLVVNKKVGDFIEDKTSLGIIYHVDSLPQGLEEKLLSAFEFSNEKVQSEKLIYKII